MREIKFRAWDKERKIMREVTCINFYDEYIDTDEKADGANHRLPITSPLMQYTGLTDKNGKEIYEGDIVEYESNSVYVKDGDTTIAEVKMKNPWLGAYPFNTQFMKENSIEVIGNIYENKELLK